MKKIYSLLLLVVFSLTSQAQVVISQVYGAGGNGGTNPATYKNDFIELFNSSTTQQTLTGWSVQYGSATGTSTWQVYPLPTVTLQPGQYYLVAGGGGTNGAALPTPDVSFSSGTPTLNMAGSNGKTALVSNTTALSGENPTGAQIIDLVGYGSTNGFETSPTAAISTITSASRLNNGCTDNGNNSMDFTVGAVNPRNTASPISVCSTEPSITITSPVNNAYLSPETTSVNVTFNVSNFVVAATDGSGDGHIHYTINGGNPVMQYTTDPINIPTTQGTTYTVHILLVDDNHTAIVPETSTTVTFEVTDYIEAFSIAEVRNAGAGDYVNFLGEAVVTYARSSTTGRNQKYIEDATGAILIDDNTNVITTPFVIGDGISNVRGLLSNFNGTLQLLPNQDATKPSTGNTITPQVVTAAQITADPEAYESELVQINNIAFTTADGSAAFAASQNYTLDDSSNITFRTLFADADYIGAIIPQGAANRIFLAAEFNQTAQVVSRSMADVTLSTTNFNNISGLNVYPNPANDFLHITTTANAVKNIAIYDVVGKEVLNTTTSNETINVSSLNTGIYMVKITEEGKTATRKLAIK